MHTSSFKTVNFKVKVKNFLNVKFNCFYIMVLKIIITFCSFACQVFLDEQDQMQFFMLWFRFLLNKMLLVKIN